MYLRIRHLSIKAPHSSRINKNLSKEKNDGKPEGLHNVVTIKCEVARIYKVIVDV